MQLPFYLLLEPPLPQVRAACQCHPGQARNVQGCAESPRYLAYNIQRGTYSKEKLTQLMIFKE